jgi:dipeptidyl aminopeptidase/acylaminoacyl peptidase
MDRVRTPVLLIAGSEDEANAAQSQEAFNALRRLGQRVELRVYNGEGHGVTGWTESNVRDVCERVLSWFNEHLKVS